MRFRCWLQITRRWGSPVRWSSPFMCEKHRSRYRHSSFHRRLLSLSLCHIVGHYDFRCWSLSMSSSLVKLEKKNNALWYFGHSRLKRKSVTSPLWLIDWSKRMSTSPYDASHRCHLVCGPFTLDPIGSKFYKRKKKKPNWQTAVILRASHPFFFIVLLDLFFLVYPGASPIWKKKFTDQLFFFCTWEKKKRGRVLFFFLFGVLITFVCSESPNERNER